MFGSAPACLAAVLCCPASLAMISSKAFCECRPPIKAYTDICATISGARATVTAAQDPAFAALAQSLQRIIPAARVSGRSSRLPPDPSGPPSLAWWDRARYMWRGRLRVTLLDLAVSLAPVHHPDARPGDPCMDITCKQLDVSCNPDAQTAVSAASLAAALRLPHHEQRSRPDAPPLRVPLCALASAAITVALGLELPHGRSAGAHHVHPVVAVGQRARLEGTQGPVDVSAMLAATAISISVAVTIHSMGLCGLVRNQALYPRFGSPAVLSSSALSASPDDSFGTDVRPHVTALLTLIMQDTMRFILWLPVHVRHRIKGSGKWCDSCLIQSVLCRRRSRVRRWPRPVCCTTARRRRRSCGTCPPRLRGRRGISALPCAGHSTSGTAGRRSRRGPACRCPRSSAAST